ncbi:MAG: DUF4147 domain-containing protein [Nanoarchaeota archaeon]
MIFSNYKKIATSKEKKLLLELASSGIESLVPKSFIGKIVKLENGNLKIKDQKFNLKNKRIFVIGAGKMSGEMAFELEKIIGGKKITYGFVNTNFIKNKPKKIIINKADHPLPSLKGVYGTKKILDIKKNFNLNENDVIIALISGGGSSLLPYPIDEISFKDKKKVIIELIKSGANVYEITIIKKKMSKVKGGKLAEYFFPSKIISLVVSDVVGNNMKIIASGPLTKDTSTFMDALNIIKKYKLQNKIPKKVLEYFIKNKSFMKEQDLSNVKQFLLASNNTLISKIENFARKLGLKIAVINNIQGEASLIAKHICDKLNKAKISPPLLIIYGGETTVTLKDRFGKGGRNQEFILACLKYFDHKKFKNFAIASIASDGIDYIKESCGAIIDKDSFKEIKRYNLDKYLSKHDSYRILKKLNANLISGLTGVNVGDIILFLFA